jgi:alpha-glucosidase (family GH31 glycosyl hydrolase)
MFGDSYLVQPVTAAGTTETTIYLPRLQPGSSWRYFFNESVVYPGGVTVKVATPYPTTSGEFPVFELV